MSLDNALDGIFGGKKEKEVRSVPTPTIYKPRGLFFNDLEKHFISLALKQYIDTYKINVIRAKDKKRCKNLEEIIKMNEIYKKLNNEEYIIIEELIKKNV